MQYVLSVDEMRLADSTAIKSYNIPGEILMENAARSAAEYIISIFEDLNIQYSFIDILCGSGNNGGDGFALARHLHEKYKVRVFWIGDSAKMSPETLTNFISIEKLGIEIYHIENEKQLSAIVFSNDCIIDSLIGVGGSENIKGLALDLLKKIEGNSALKIAIDSPTGLNAVTGIAGSHCFIADYTITMFAVKTGMLINEGQDVCGTILTAYLGAPEKIVRELSKIKIIENEDFKGILPIRKRVSSKFDYGRVSILAGSKNFPGASALCANSAITAGSGLVHLYSTVIHHSLLPEVIPHLLPETETGSISAKSLEFITPELDKSDVIVIGPGLSDNPETINLMSSIIDKYKENKVIIVDADGLKAINSKQTLTKNVILTPHCGEFSKITGKDRKEIETNSLNLAKEWAKKLNCIIALKHIPVVITDGSMTYLNITGNPGMATGGSGDVLTGLIGGLAAQGLSAINATAYGVFIHAKAGDFYAGKYSEETLTASAILNLLPEAMKLND